MKDETIKNKMDSLGYSNEEKYFHQTHGVVETKTAEIIELKVEKDKKTSSLENSEAKGILDGIDTWVP